MTAYSGRLRGLTKRERVIVASREYGLFSHRFRGAGINSLVAQYPCRHTRPGRIAAAAGVVRRVDSGRNDSPHADRDCHRSPGGCLKAPHACVALRYGAADAVAAAPTGNRRLGNPLSFHLGISLDRLRRQADAPIRGWTAAATPCAADRVPPVGGESGARYTFPAVALAHFKERVSCCPFFPQNYV